MWTPPHFWALALYKRGDYDRAGIPMMPVVKGEASTKRQIFAYALILAATGLAPFFVGMAGYLFLAVSIVLGAGFIWCSWRVLKSDEGDYGPAKKLFGFSLIYLTVIFATLLIENLTGLHG